MRNKKPQEEQPAKPPIDVDALADAIKSLSDGAKKMHAGRLGKRAIIILLHDACGGSVTKTDVERVLDAMPELEKRFLR